jgi:predicted N-acetyltransferase YhbS
MLLFQVLHLSLLIFLQLFLNYLVYLLAPVAVYNKFQKQGIGQKIIQFALKYLKKQKVDLLITYGDPRY